MCPARARAGGCDAATGPDCPLGTDPARATETFQAIVRPLLDRPVPYGGQQLTYNDAIGAVIGALYLRDSWPGIPMGLVELQAGNPDRFVLLNQLASGREPDGSGSNASAANLAISCLDEQRMTTEQTTDLRNRIYEAAPSPLIRSRAGELLGVRHLGERQEIRPLDPHFAAVLEKLST